MRPSPAKTAVYLEQEGDVRAGGVRGCFRAVRSAGDAGQAERRARIDLLVGDDLRADQAVGSGL